MFSDDSKTSLRNVLSKDCFISDKGCCIELPYLSRGLECDRNTIHKNLVLCLFIAEIIFLLGIGQYEHKVSFTAITNIFGLVVYIIPFLCIYPFIPPYMCTISLLIESSILLSGHSYIRPSIHASIQH